MNSTVILMRAGRAWFPLSLADVEKLEIAGMRVPPVGIFSDCLDGVLRRLAVHRLVLRLR